MCASLFHPTRGFSVSTAVVVALREHRCQSCHSMGPSGHNYAPCPALARRQLDAPPTLIQSECGTAVLEVAKESRFPVRELRSHNIAILLLAAILLKGRSCH